MKNLITRFLGEGSQRRRCEGWVLGLRGEQREVCDGMVRIEAEVLHQLHLWMEHGIAGRSKFFSETREDERRDEENQPCPKPAAWVERFSCVGENIH